MLLHRHLLRLLQVQPCKFTSIVCPASQPDYRIPVAPLIRLDHSEVCILLLLKSLFPPVKHRYSDPHGHAYCFYCHLTLEIHKQRKYDKWETVLHKWNDLLRQNAVGMFTVSAFYTLDIYPRVILEIIRLNQVSAVVKAVSDACPFQLTVAALQIKEIQILNVGLVGCLGHQRNF